MPTFTNETLVERIMTYVHEEYYKEAETLATLADYLEECYTWDVAFE